MSQYNSRILGTGSYLPKKVLTNAELEKMVDTTDQWIMERTGIRERRIGDADNGEANSDLSAFAGKAAIEMAGIDPNEIDLIILATSSPDYKLPNTSSLIQQKIGITNECPCFDMSAACSGFVYAYSIANALIANGQHEKILIIGSELINRYVDWTDRTTCILFGDGAGACVLGRDTDDSSKMLGSKLGCDGTGHDYLMASHGGTRHPVDETCAETKSDKIIMNGKQIFKYATRTLIKNVVDLLGDLKINPSEIDWLVPHQANLRIIEYVTKKLELDPEKVVVTVDKYGNNSAATIPIALDEAIRDGRIKRGDLLLFDAFGAGVSSGAVALRY